MREKTILVVVDPAAGPGQPVLERAGWLARQGGSRLELFACDYDPAIDSGRVDRVWVPEPGAREQLVARHRRTLEEFANTLRARGMAVTVDVVWDHPFDEAIIKKAAAHDYWLVAKDTHHHNVLQRTLLTQTDWHLIRKCPAPLLLVKDRKLAVEPNVLAAVDPVNEHDKPAALDDRIFHFGAELAAVVRGHLHVVHAFAAPMGVELPPDVREVLAEEHRKAMREFLDSHPVVAEQAYLYEGLAHECLQQAAKDHAADFVVMGAVARSGLKRLFIGSTAERVLDRLPCDLVIIKPLGFEVPEGAE
ncbi:MAG TPA: universal stress protein [Gammaproteobacteria bacterium]|jgi:universal stress protein E|nr:universal stress protein [Gammaproteobacteria bacterium]